MNRILLVEDNQMIRENLIEVLELARYSVLIASNGEEGIRTALRELPDLILSDILMPSMDGYGMLVHLRREPSLARTPIIFFTALSESAEISKAMTMGATDYIVKPFDPDELLEKLEKHLSVGRRPDICNQ